jgi:hypothetical protein
VQENDRTSTFDNRLLRNAGTYSQITRHHIPEDRGFKVRGSPRTRGPEVTEQWCEEHISIMKGNRSTASDLQAPCPKSIAYMNTACYGLPRTHTHTRKYIYIYIYIYGFYIFITHTHINI